MRRMVLLVCSVLCAVSPLLAFQQVTEGMFRVEFERPDDLLLLNDIPQVHVIVVSGEDASSLSEVHLLKLRDWMARGGVLWVEGRRLVRRDGDGGVPVEYRAGG